MLNKVNNFPKISSTTPPYALDFLTANKKGSEPVSARSHSKNQRANLPFKHTQVHFKMDKLLLCIRKKGRRKERGRERGMKGRRREEGRGKRGEKKEK